MGNVRKITAGEISLGQSLAWPVYDMDSALLLTAGTIIRSEKQLSVILEKGVYRGLSEGEALEADKKAVLQVLSNKKPSNPFQMKSICAQKLQHLAIELLAGKATSIMQTVRMITAHINDGCQLNANATLAAVHLAGELNYSIVHPLHAAILCKLLMSRLSFSDEQHDTIIAAALLMNMGMFKLQNELFEQADPLTEAQKLAVHQHPEKSVEILKKAGLDDSALFDIILQHHERLDGAGYPDKLTGDAIHQGAKIVALADLYAAMITPRAYREPVKAQWALKKIFTDRGKGVDNHLAQLLIREVGVYPPGSFVKLINGDTAIVIKRAIVKKGRDATAPVVACIISPRGGMYEKPALRDSNLEMYKITGLAEPDFDEPMDFSVLWGHK